MGGLYKSASCPTGPVPLHHQGGGGMGVGSVGGFGGMASQPANPFARAQPPAMHGMPPRGSANDLMEHVGMGLQPTLSNKVKGGLLCGGIGGVPAVVVVVYGHTCTTRTPTHVACNLHVFHTFLYTVSSQSPPCQVPDGSNLLLPPLVPATSMAPAHSQGHISTSSPRSAASFNAPTGSSTSPATAGGDIPGDSNELLASLASIRSALASGKLQQQDVLRMLGEMSLAGGDGSVPLAAPTSTESGSGTSATLTAGMSMPLPTDDDTARLSGSKSASPGPDAAEQFSLSGGGGGGLQPAGSSVVLPAPPATGNPAMMGRLWHTSSAPAVGGVQTTLLVCWWSCVCVC